MYGIVLYQQKFPKLEVLAQGACTLAVLGSMQREHKTIEITDTVLKSIITQFRHHICSSKDCPLSQPLDNNQKKWIN